MQQNDLFRMTVRMDSQGVTTFPRRGEGKLDSLSFINARDQQMTCPLGPRVFWGGGHSLHILLNLDTAQPESLK